MKTKQTQNQHKPYLISQPSLVTILFQSTIKPDLHQVTMDVDFWASRVHSAKLFPFVKAARHNNLPDGDDDARVCIACPLCDVDIEVLALCSHLQEDHGFELKNALCPLCAANLGKDVIGHFTTHHTSSLKYQRKAQKSGTWTGTSAMLGKELRSFLGSSTNGRENACESVPNQLLLPFFGSVSHLDHEGTGQNEFSHYSATLASHSERNEIPSAGVNNNVDCEERRHRVAFVQQLIASAIV